MPAAFCCSFARGVRAGDECRGHDAARRRAKSAYRPRPPDKLAPAALHPELTLRCIARKSSRIGSAFSLGLQIVAAEQPGAALAEIAGLQDETLRQFARDGQVPHVHRRHLEILIEHRDRRGAGQHLPGRCEKRRRLRRGRREFLREPFVDPAIRHRRATLRRRRAGIGLARRRQTRHPYPRPR